MKLTKQQLKRIIKEELAKIMEDETPVIDAHGNLTPPMKRVKIIDGGIPKRVDLHTCADIQKYASMFPNNSRYETLKRLKQECQDIQKGAEQMSSGGSVSGTEHEDFRALPQSSKSDFLDAKFEQKRRTRKKQRIIK